MILFQMCSIEMAMGTLDRSTVMLIPDNLMMKQNVDMSIFLITDWHLKPVGQGLSMIVVLKRKITSEIMTTYFPSLLLIAITFATTFFKPFFFEAALSVNLTTMLVMTTIFISKMEGLPPTSDVKMIDYWLIFCQLVPFVQVVFITVIEYLPEEEKQEEEQFLKKDDLQQDSPNSDIQDLKDEPKLREAWSTTKMKTNFVSKLVLIGKF